MKKYISLFCQFICAILIFSTPAVAVENKVLTFSGIEESDYARLGALILEAVYAEIGLEVEFKYYPGKRALKISNSGESDGEIFRVSGISNRFKNLLLIPTPIAFLNGIVLTKSKKFDVQGWDSIKQYSIGVKRGIIWSENPTRMMLRTIVKSNRQLIRMLDNGRIDVALIAELNAMSVLKKENISGIKLLKPPIVRVPLYHYVHKRNQELISRIDAAIKLLNKNSTIQKITAQFINELSN